MKNVSELYTKAKHPVRILQFGEGNFLRAFVDYAVDIANEENGFDGSVAVIMPRSGKTNRFAKQDDVYTACLRGQQDGKVYKENRVITSVQTVLSARDEYDAFMAWLTKIRWNSSYRIRRKPVSPLMKRMLLQIARRRLSRQN